MLIITKLYLLISLCITTLHPVHVALTTVEYNTDKECIDIGFKFFFDDFEEVIRRKYNVELKLGTIDQNKDYNKYVKKYISEHFQLTINNNIIDNENIKAIRKDMNFEAVWFYYQVPFKSKITSVKIRNSIMTDLYLDQKNILFFKNGDEEKATILNFKKTVANFTLNED